MTETLQPTETPEQQKPKHEKLKDLLKDKQITILENSSNRRIKATMSHRGVEYTISLSLETGINISRTNSDQQQTDLSDDEFFRLLLLFRYKVEVAFLEFMYNNQLNESDEDSEIYMHMATILIILNFDALETGISTNKERIQKVFERLKSSGENTVELVLVETIKARINENATQGLTEAKTESQSH